VPAGANNTCKWQVRSEAAAWEQQMKSTSISSKSLVHYGRLADLLHLFIHT